MLYRGGAEQKIRKYLIDNNYVDTVFQLPPDLFFGTSIATCIIVLKKSKKDNSILFVDGSAEFVHEGNKNKLAQANIDHLLTAFVERQDADHFCKLVSCEEVVSNDCNLSVSSYVEQEDTREEVDIVELNRSIAEIVARQQVLRAEIDKIVLELER